MYLNVIISITNRVIFWEFLDYFLDMSSENWFTSSSMVKIAEIVSVNDDKSSQFSTVIAKMAKKTYNHDNSTFVIKYSSKF